MGGSTYVLPTADTAGYSLYPGTSKVGCDCLIGWLRVFERLCLAHGYIKSNLDILQLTGDYAMSGGNHRAGGVFDIKQYDLRIVMLAREMGAPATWLRNMNYADGSPGNTHTHGVVHCAHSWPADYQTTAQRRGYDGMGQGAAGTAYAGMWGYGGKDPHPRPSVYRTPAEGIAWAEAEISRIEDDGMAVEVTHPITGVKVPVEDALWSMWTYILEARDTPAKVWSQTVSRDGKAISVKQELADAKTNTLKLLGTAAQPAVADVDEAAIASAVAAALEASGIQLDPETVKAAAQAGAAEALKGLTLSVV